MRRGPNQLPHVHQRRFPAVIFYLPAVILSCALPRARAAAETNNSWLEVAARGATFLKQEGESKFGQSCAPIAALYSLKYGPASAQNVFGALPGESDEAKLSTFYAMADQNRPGLHGADPQLRWSVTPYLPDIATMLTNVAVALQGSRLEFLAASLEREPAENAPGALARRAHSLIKQNLLKGYPTPVGFYRQTVANDGWKSFGGHSVVIVGIESDPARSGLSFAFDYFDPADGALHRGFAFEDLHQGSNAYLFRFGTGARDIWTGDMARPPTVNAGSRSIVSPYLSLSLPEESANYDSGVRTQTVVIGLIALGRAARD